MSRILTIGAWALGLVIWGYDLRTYHDLWGITMHCERIIVVYWLVAGINLAAFILAIATH